jgi:flagellar hook-associated protein 2
VSTSPVNVPFTGISQYASDFQSILNKAATVAQIPVNLLQSQDSTVLQKETAYGSLNTAVANLGSSLQKLGTLAAGQAIGATSSDDSVVTVTNSGATIPATYTINSVTSIAAAASERTTSSFADSSSTPVSATGAMKLVVGSHTYPIPLSNNNNTLVGLRDAINTLGAGVTASILTTSGGNYLSISANSTGATTLQLIDDPSGAARNILTNTNQGTNAEFHLNGIDVTQPGNVVNSVVPGLTFTVLQQSNTPVTLSLQSDPSQLSSALQDFVTNYNALQTAVQQQTGNTGGALTGDTIVNQVQQVMRQVTSQFASSGTVRSLADLGVTFSESGTALFDQTTFDSLSGSQISDAFKYIGSTTSGLGGFSSALTQFSDPITGLIQTEVAGLKKTDESLQNQIATLTTRISTMQTSLTAKLEAADALQAQLQSQQQALTASLQGMNLVLYGRNTTSF